MRCPACQTDNPDSARTCVQCGVSLASPDFSNAAMGTVYEGGHGTGGLNIHEGPTMQVGAAPAAISTDAIPQRIENYEILRKEDGTLWELGRGAMGITYKAHDTDLQVDVVLKVINPAAIENADARERFLREARAAAKLRHANIASVFRLGQVNGVQFYAMEFCDGQSLHQFIERNGQLDVKLALEITLQVVNALVVAQELGVVHRDIKPSNLMITGRPPEEFTVKVIDFGLAKLGAPGTAASSEVTIGSARTGFVGTAHFASPEQLENRAVDFRSDIYSVGVTLWFMLTGKPLFEGSMMRVAMQHLSLRPPLEKLTDISPSVRALFETMLAKAPEDRPASTRDLRAMIQNCLAELAPGARPAAGASSAGVPATGWPPAEGQTVAGRYQLVAKLGATLFRALDLGSGGEVFAARLIEPKFVADEGTWAQLERDVKTLSERPHSGLIAPRCLEHCGEGALLGIEWVEGFTLREVMAARGALPLADVVLLSRPLAAAIDYAQRLKLTRLEVDARQLRVHCPGMDAATARWENAVVKISAFRLEASTDTAATVAPGDATRQLVRVVFELLGGTPGGTFAALPGLTAGGNELVRAALEGTRRFASATEFVNTLAAMSALRAPGTTSAPGSAARFAPPPTTPPGGMEQTATRLAATIASNAAPPPMPPAPRPAPLVPPPLPPPVSLPVAQPSPVANPLLIIALGLVVLFVFGLAGFLFTPMGRRLLHREPAQESQTDLPIKNDVPPVKTPPPVANPDAAIAFREARTAQEAAEKFSQTLHNYEVNRKLLDLKQNAPIPDPDGVQTYRLAEQAIERNLLDAETAYLLAAKRLNKMSPETVREAFAKLDDDVASVGVNWRTRVNEIIKADIPKVAPDAVRMDPATRDELKRLQAER